MDYVASAMAAAALPIKLLLLVLHGTDVAGSSRY